MQSGMGTLLTRIIKYYCYIVDKENDEVVKTCMNYYDQKMRVRGKLNLNFRIDRVVSMLEKIGLKYVWQKMINQEDDLRGIIRKIEDRCNDIFKQESIII